MEKKYNSVVLALLVVHSKCTMSSVRAAVGALAY
jgi:hypothetical protein